jgi:hypothetical protein
MDTKDVLSFVIQLLQIIISWQFLTFIIVLVFRKNISAVLSDLIKRINKAPGGWEFSEVEEEIAAIANNYEIINENKNNQLKIDPYSIRLKHSSVKIGIKYWRVEVWVDAPKEFLERIQKIKYERHPTFKNLYYETSEQPFRDSFKCWGEFTIKAEITINDGNVIKRQRYISLLNE